MNINTSGIISKLKNKADIVAFIVSNYEQHGGVGKAFNYYTQSDMEFLKEAGRTFTTPGLLKHKLWDSPHLYTTLIKTGIFAYLGIEIGVLDKKWKSTIEKMIKGAGLAALTNYGSGPSGSSGGSSQENYEY